MFKKSITCPYCFGKAYYYRGTDMPPACWNSSHDGVYHCGCKPSGSWGYCFPGSYKLEGTFGCALTHTKRQIIERYEKNIVKVLIEHDQAKTDVEAKKILWHYVALKMETTPDKLQINCFNLDTCSEIINYLNGVEACVYLEGRMPKYVNTPEAKKKKYNVKKSPRIKNKNIFGNPINPKNPLRIGDLDWLQPRPEDIRLKSDFWSSTDYGYQGYQASPSNKLMSKEQRDAFNKILDTVIGSLKTAPKIQTEDSVVHSIKSTASGLDVKKSKDFYNKLDKDLESS